MTSPPPKLTITDLLGQPLDGVARIVLRHRRQQAFRWLFIIELTLFIALMCCLIPAFVLLILVGRDLEFTIPSIEGRAFRRWHEISLELVGPDGQIMSQVIEKPRSQNEGHAVVSTILSAADREGLVVVQVIGRELANIWYGGQPLLAEPSVITKVGSQQLIEVESGTVTWSEEALEIRFPGTPAAKLVALVGLILLWPLLFWFAAGRRSMVNLWDDVRGINPPYWQFEVRAESICLTEQRGDHVSFQKLVRGSDLVGIAWCASLGFDRDVTRRSPHLRWMCRDSLVELPFPKDPSLGRAVRDLLLAGSIEFRARRPELGLMTQSDHPAHCPYCATLYSFGPGVRCPSCGAPCTGLAALV